MTGGKSADRGEIRLGVEKALLKEREHDDEIAERFEHGERLLADELLGLVYANSLNERSLSVLKHIYLALNDDQSSEYRLELKRRRRGRKKKPRSDNVDQQVHHFVFWESKMHGSKEAAVADACAKFSMSRSGVFAALKAAEEDFEAYGINPEKLYTGNWSPKKD